MTRKDPVEYNLHSPVVFFAFLTVHGKDVAHFKPELARSGTDEIKNRTACG